MKRWIITVFCKERRNAHVFSVPDPLDKERVLNLISEKFTEKVELGFFPLEDSYGIQAFFLSRGIHIKELQDIPCEVLYR